MKPYSEDLRIRIVKAVEEGTSKSATARLFDVSLSSDKRYVRSASRGESLAPRKKGGGRPPKVDLTTQKLLQEDVKKRPAVTVSERRRFLEQLTGKALSDSTIQRLLKRLGFSQITERGSGRARRVLKSRLEEDDLREGGAEAVRLRGRNGHQHFALTALRLVAARREGVVFCASQPRAEHHFAFEHEP